MSSMPLPVDSETDIANSRVLQKVFPFLDWKSKKVVREVCRSWKEELDDSGLNIKIDNGCNDNVGFSSKALAKKINVVNSDTNMSFMPLPVDSETGMANSLVLQKVFPFLDWKSKKVVREVCRLWKEELEDSGLNIKIDNGSSENVPFVSKILAQQINVVNIDTNMSCMPLPVDSETGIANSRVLQKVFPFLDLESKKVVREVCHFWKEELDDSGLNIKIDNGSSENVPFVSNILAKKINVVNIDTNMSSKPLPVDSETGIANSQVLQKVFPFLDSKSKKMVRRVCRSWKEELDNSGLNIKINNRSSRNVKFVSKVLAKKINVVNIDTNYKRVQLKYPNEVISVKCVGKIEPFWFIKDILTGCGNLTELHLTGSFLVSQEIGNLKRVRTGWLAAKIEMQNLKILRIEFGFEACQKYLNLHAPQGTIDRVISSFKFEKIERSSMRQIFDTNMTFLLSQIRSPKLNILYIYDVLLLYTCRDMEWKDDPIVGFLNSHPTLTRIYLPSFQDNFYSTSSEFTPNSSTGYPENLKTLEVILSIQPQNESASISFMQKLLLAQKSLEEIHLEDWTFDVSFNLNCRQVVVNNSSTLTYIHLSFVQSNMELLTGDTFQNCFNLQSFILQHVQDRPGSSKFYNFNLLPKSLKTIHISAIVVIDSDSDSDQTLDFRKFDSLQILELRRIRVIPVNIPSFTTTISATIMNALRLRRLNYLFLGFSNHLLLSRNKNLADAIVALANPTDQVDINEPFEFFSIGKPHSRSPISTGSHFLSISPHERTDLDLNYGRRSAEASLVPVKQVTVSSNVHNVPCRGVLETFWGKLQRLVNRRDRH